MQDLLFIYNPHSGKGMVKEYLSDIIDQFVKAGYQVGVYPTQGKQDATEQVLHCSSHYNMVVCSGGDGTLNEVVSGIMELKCKPVIGYIPAGSTNDFANSIRLPKDMKEAAKIAVSGIPISVDIGLFNKKYFTYIAGFGAFTEVSYMTPQEMKNILGHQAYLLKAARQLTSLRAYHMKVTYDMGELESDFIYGMVTNSISVGGMKRLTGKNVVLDDGLFEVTLVRQPKNPMDIQMIMSSLIGFDVKTDAVYSFKTSKIEFQSDEKVQWVLDGEYGGAPKKVKIENLNKAIRIMSGISKKTD